MAIRGLSASSFFPNEGYFFKEPDWMNTFKELDEAHERKEAEAKQQANDELRGLYSERADGSTPTPEDIYDPLRKWALKHGRIEMLDEIDASDPNSVSNKAKVLEEQKKATLGVLKAADENPILAREMAKAVGLSEDTLNTIDSIYGAGESRRSKSKESTDSKSYKYMHDPKTGDTKTVTTRSEADALLSQGYVPGQPNRGSDKKSIKDEVLDRLSGSAKPKGSDIDAIEGSRKAPVPTPTPSALPQNAPKPRPGFKVQYNPKTGQYREVPR